MGVCLEVIVDRVDGLRPAYLQADRGCSLVAQVCHTRLCQSDWLSHDVFV